LSLAFVIVQTFVAGGTVESTLTDLQAGKPERTLVACDASRSDLLLGLTAAHRCRAGPHVAGLLITGGMPVQENVQKIIQVRRIEHWTDLKLQRRMVLTLPLQGLIP